MSSRNRAATTSTSVRNSTIAPQFLGNDGGLPLEYTIDGENRIRWFDESTVIKHNRTVSEEPEYYFHSSFEDDGHKISYGVDNWYGRRWAVGGALDIEEMEYYRRHVDYDWSDSVEAANTAYRNPVMQRFTKRMWHTMNKGGVSDPVQKLDALADYIPRAENAARKPISSEQHSAVSRGRRALVTSGVIAMANPMLYPPSTKTT